MVQFSGQDTKLILGLAVIGAGIYWYTLRKSTSLFEDVGGAAASGAERVYSDVGRGATRLYGDVTGAADKIGSTGYKDVKKQAGKLGKWLRKKL